MDEWTEDQDNTEGTEENTADKEQLKKEISRHAVLNMTLMNNRFLSVFFRDRNDLVELVLRIIMNNPTLEVLESSIQDFLANLWGKSVCMDVTAKDSSGALYDIEIQRASEGAIPMRARFYSSARDMRILDAGSKYKELPESYVIFLTEEDFFKEGKGLYAIDRYRRSDGPVQYVPFGDRSHILYVNGTYRGDDDLGRLMGTFSCSDPEDMFFPELRDRARDLKKEGESLDQLAQLIYDDMSDEEKNQLFGKGHEEGFAEGHEKGVEEGVELGLEKGARATSSYLYAQGFQVTEIAKAVRFNEDVIKDWLGL